jgi:hypothetical protein
MEKEKIREKIADIQSQMKKKCTAKNTHKCKLSNIWKRLPEINLEFERKTRKLKKRQGSAHTCPTERVFANRREESQTNSAACRSV